MKPIRIFTPNMDLLAEISNYEYLMFTRSFHGIGKLELRINRYKKYTEFLQKNNVIVIANQKNKAYQIKHREIELDQSGKITENWIIKGLELKSVMSQRITLPPSHTAYDNKQGPAETVMQHYIKNNLIYPSDTKRRIEQLILSVDQGRGNNVSWQSRFKNVAEELETISLLTGLGWNVSVDYQLKKWVFDVIENRDFTVNGENPVIFSPDFDNIKNMHFSDSDLNYKNTTYVAGQGEGTNRRVIELGDSEGLSRHEVFVDARDVSEETNDYEPRPEQDIIKDLTTRGEQTLSQLNAEIFLEAQIMTPIIRTEYEKETTFITQFQPTEDIQKKTKVYSTFVYEQDYDLGDLVTVQNKDWGITLNTPITEITEIYEPSSFKLEAIFGHSRPTLIDKMKQQLEQISPEIRR